MHRRFRPLFHSGDQVRFDTEEAYVAHGVYATDRSEALVSFACVASAISLTPPPFLLPGLDADRRYRVTHVALPGERGGLNRTRPVWFDEGVDITGDWLAQLGLQLPAMHPETAVLLHLVAPDA